MLIELRLKDFALADALAFEPEGGLVAVTGETGAGKSLLVNALSFVTGQRAPAEWVRSGASRCEVAAVFAVTAPDRFREWLEPSDASLVLRRDLSMEGRSRAWINDRPVPVSALKRAGQQLCDLHGQNQHQWLQDPDHHAGYLDRFVPEPVLSGYRQAFDHWSQGHAALRAHRETLDSHLRQKDFWEFQRAELDRLDPRPGEYEELENRRSLLKAGLQRALLLQGVTEELAQADSGLVTRLSRIVARLGELRTEEEWAAHLRQALLSLEEAERSLARAPLGASETDDSLEAIERRLHALYGLKKKFGGSLDTAVAERVRIAENLQFLARAEDEGKRLERALKAAAEQLAVSGRKLEEARTRAVAQMRAALRKPLAELGLGSDPISVLQAPLAPELWTREGSTRVEFLLQANPGEAPKALSKIASGGELSRIMLGLKSVLPGSLEVDTLVFDEIDAGIGGETAVSVGKKLLSLAEGRQVIVVTHLHQIAALADLHFAVRKVTRAGRHVPEIRRLSAEEREAALARMIAGDRAGDRERRAARSMLRSGRSD